MDLLVTLLGIYTPSFVRKQALRALFRCTAAALQVAPPALGRCSAGALLRDYAEFTSSHVAARIDGGCDMKAVEQCLYGAAVELGQRWSGAFHIRSMDDMRRVGRVLYRVLGIDFQSDERGEVVISRCFFSEVYSAAVCQVMSAMDRGLFAGLSGGGQLEFSARITEGQCCCRAQFTLRIEGLPLSIGDGMQSCAASTPTPGPAPDMGVEKEP